MCYSKLTLFVLLFNSSDNNKTVKFTARSAQWEFGKYGVLFVCLSCCLSCLAAPGYEPQPGMPQHPSRSPIWASRARSPAQRWPTRARSRQLVWHQSGQPRALPRWRAGGAGRCITGASAGHELAACIGTNKAGTCWLSVRLAWNWRHEARGFNPSTAPVCLPHLHGPPAEQQPDRKITHPRVPHTFSDRSPSDLISAYSLSLSLFRYLSIYISAIA